MGFYVLSQCTHSWCSFKLYFIVHLHYYLFCFAFIPMAIVTLAGKGCCMFYSRCHKMGYFLI